MRSVVAMSGVRSSPVRTLARRTARSVGLERQAVDVYEGVLRAFENPQVRRNRRDDEVVRLLAAAVLGADSNCVDVGANVGQLLRIFTEVAPIGSHIAYEPVPSLAAALTEHFPAVDVRAAAVSDRSGESEFVLNTRLPSRSSLRAVGDGSQHTEVIRVPVERLDDALPRGYVPHLLKVDVEGAEHLVLEGARELLTAHRPVLVFEHQRSTARHYGSSPDLIYGLVADDLRMRIFDLSGGGPYSPSQFRDAYERGRRWNFFAVPAGQHERGAGR